jgi:predicted amidohydrolase
LIIEGVHQAVLINEHGLLATQQQLHFCQRYQWTPLGDELTIIELPLEQGNIIIAMLTADDANIPEVVKVATLHGIHVLLVPFDIQEPSEVSYSLLSRAAENRICIVAASREKSFANQLAADNTSDNIYGKNKVKEQKSTGLIANLTTDPALLPQWRTRQFTGYINQPLVKLQYGKITKAVVHPIAACSKV